MPVDDPRDLEGVHRDLHIEELKRRIEAVSGGPAVNRRGNDCPPEVAEQFFENVLAHESTEEPTLWRRLTAAGLEIPAPDDLTDEALTAKLWELIRAMAETGNFLHHTDHLSDRELYADLYEETLHEIMANLPPELGGSWHIDLAGSGSEEDMLIYLKYYADEDARARWAKDFHVDVPPHEDPPYDRDRLLPRSPDEGEMASEDEDEDADAPGDGEDLPVRR